MSWELHGGEKKSNYMLEIDILRNSSQKNLGVLRGAFKGLGCLERHPIALLAKTMAIAQKHDRHICNVLGKIFLDITNNEK